MNARFLVELAEVMGVAIEQLKHGNIRQRAIGAHLAEYKKEVIMLSQTWRDPDELVAMTGRTNHHDANS